MKDVFEIGAHIDEGWSADNKEKAPKDTFTDIKEPHKHQLHFTKEKRRGKVVTIVKPFYLRKSALQNLVKTLKKKLGTGGTVKENTLEFQGDIPEQVRKHLKSMGYRFKN